MKNDNRVIPQRCLHLQEYQSKQLLADHGVAIQRFRVASNVEEVESLTKDLCKFSIHSLAKPSISKKCCSGCLLPVFNVCSLSIIYSYE